MKKIRQNAFTLVDVLICSAFFLVFVTVTIPGAIRSTNRYKERKKSSESQNIPTFPSYFGRNLFIFPFSGNDIRKEIVLFLENHPELEVLESIRGIERDHDVRSVDRQNGHMVFFRIKK